MLWYLDGASHFLANIASSVIWLVVTCALWVCNLDKMFKDPINLKCSTLNKGSAAGIMHNTRSGGNCAGRATISRCRQSLTVEALGWTEFSLFTLTIIATCIWVYGGHRARKATCEAASDV